MNSSHHSNYSNPLDLLENIGYVKLLGSEIYDNVYDIKPFVI